MTNEEKDLLFKDLCARLPYYVRVNYKGEVYDVLGIINGRLVLCKPFQSHGLEYNPLVEEVKPYLFPMSSMTEEQRREYTKAQSDDGDIVFSCAIKYVETGADIVSAEYHATDWLNAHHFDYRGLIEKGLAIDATELNVY